MKDVLNGSVLDFSLSSPLEVTLEAALESPEAALESPEVALETPEVVLETPEVSLETPEVALETPDVEEESMTPVAPPIPPLTKLLVDRDDDVMASLPGEERK